MGEQSDGRHYAGKRTPGSSSSTGVNDVNGQGLDGVSKRIPPMFPFREGGRKTPSSPGARAKENRTGRNE